MADILTLNCDKKQTAGTHTNTCKWIAIKIQGVKIQGVYRELTKSTCTLCDNSEQVRMGPSETWTCNEWGAKILRIRGDASDRYIFQHFVTYYFTKCTVHLLLFCTMTNKCTIISQIITLLHVSILSCHLHGACNQYHAQLHKYFKCSCW